MFSKLKSLLKKLPVPLTKNHRYDLLTKKIIQQHCKDTSNCIDVGSHEGAILDWFLRYAPNGKHYAFEPIPALHLALKEKYREINCTIYNIALSDNKGVAPFNYVISNPAYSGLRKRKYDRKKETDTIIQVKTDVLDNLIPPDIRIDFIKIDVEGGELNVLKGAKRILSRDHPVVVFEFGLGGSDVYGANPDELFTFFQSLGFSIFLLRDFLQKKKCLSLTDLNRQFYERINYYFVAY